MEFPFQSIQDKIPVLISKNLKSRYQLLAWKPSYEELTKKVILELHSIIKKGRGSTQNDQISRDEFATLCIASLNI